MMLAYTDTTLMVDEKKSARIDARMQPTVKDTINRAAVLNGLDVSSYIASVAFAAAQETLEAHELTDVASDADRQVFFYALDNPPAPSEHLLAAYETEKNLFSDDG